MIKIRPRTLIARLMTTFLATSSSTGGAHTRKPRSPRLALLLTALILLTIIIGALVATTVTRQRVHLDNGTVWVTSSTRRSIARFNVRVGQIDASIPASTPRFDVAQSGDGMAMIDSNIVTSVDTATLSTDAQITVSEHVQISLAASTVALLDTANGHVRVGPLESLEALAASQSDPTMKLGEGGMIAISHDGIVYGYRPRDGMVITADANGSVQDVISLSDGRSLHANSFTVVGSVPVIAVQGAILWPDGVATVDSTDTLTLQSPDVDGNQGSWVAAADRNGLFVVQLRPGSSQALRLNTTGEGTPAQPVSVAGCVYAAWSQPARNYRRICDADGNDVRGNQGEFQTLTSVSNSAYLQFRTNHRLVVLNDAASGRVWDPQSAMDAVDVSWDSLQQEGGDTAHADTIPTSGERREYAEVCSEHSGQPRAVDDHMGIRAGSTRILDVLHNDEQSDCSVLRIISITSPSVDDVTVSAIHDGRYIQFNATALTDTNSNDIRFSYEIDDGRGRRSSATVIVKPVSHDHNQPAAQTDIPPEYEIEQGAVLSVNALASFTDADGDPMSLIDATVLTEAVTVTQVRADGLLTLSARADASGRVPVRVTVYDGRATSDGLLYVSVHPANTLPARIDPIIISTKPDTPVMVDITPYVHATSARMPTLSTVQQPADTITAKRNDLSFTVMASTPGTYYVSYTIMQGDVSTDSIARVEVIAQAPIDSIPVTADDVAILSADGTAIVEPLINDRDPSGGVLAITSVDVEPSAGISASISGTRVYVVGQRIPNAPVSIRYTASNQTGSSVGTIVVYPPAARRHGMIVARDITLNVRTGGIASATIHDYILASSDTEVTLDHDLQYNHDVFKGLLFVSDDTIRYQAGSVSGRFEATYTVHDDVGNRASGTIIIEVHQADAQSKADPKPFPVQAQVAAGRTVRLEIALTGIDVDGDDVTLLGLGNRVPSLGRIIDIGANYMVYEAYADSTGTDLFSYAVEDWSGRRAQADISVAVFHQNTADTVLARDDDITLRPNTRASIQVTNNDIVSDDSVISVSRLDDVQGIADATYDQGTIMFTTPHQEGTAYVVYTVQNEAGLSSTATLTIHIDAAAPIYPPMAQDHRIPAADTIDKRSVEVDVAAWINNPSGTADELTVTIDSSAADHARRIGDESSTIISIDLTEQARAVPYTVTNTTYGVSSTAFIHVPAYGVFPPLLRPNAPSLTVRGGDALIIRIADHVRVGVGKTAFVTSAEEVSATKSENTDLFVDTQTLRFIPQDGYAGPASITFAVVDADPSEHTSRIVNRAVLTLPITVTGTTIAPPLFVSPTVDVPAGETTVIDLSAFTRGTDSCAIRRNNNVDGNARDNSNPSTTQRCIYESAGADDDRITVSVTSDGMMTIRAVEHATAGDITVPITIRYEKGTVSGHVIVRTTISSRPLARLNQHRLTVHAGASATVNVLEQAYNPFPQKALSVVDCVVDGSHEINVAQCPDNGMVSITVADNAQAGVSTLRVTVQDSTGSPDRQVRALVEITIIARPSTPLMLPIDKQPHNASVNLAWVAGATNGSPILEYLVEWDGGSHSCGLATTCRISGLTNGRQYTFTVKARNEVGWSDASAAVVGMPDVVPPQPINIVTQAGYRRVTVHWNMPEYIGSKTERFIVTVSDASGRYHNTQSTNGTSIDVAIPDEAINDETTFRATVTAYNRVGGSIAGTSNDDARPWSDPDPPKLVLTQEGNQITARVTLGNMRNAGCAQVTLEGAVTRTLSCESLSTSFPLTKNENDKSDNDDIGNEDADNELNKLDHQSDNAITVTATLHLRRSISSIISATATITPTLPEIPEPEPNPDPTPNPEPDQPDQMRNPPSTTNPINRHIPQHTRLIPIEMM